MESPISLICQFESNTVPSGANTLYLVLIGAIAGLSLMCSVIGLRDRKQLQPNQPLLAQLTLTQRLALVLGSLIVIALAGGIAISVTRSLIAFHNGQGLTGPILPWSPVDGIIASIVLCLTGVFLRIATKDTRMTPLIFMTTILGAGYVGLFLPLARTEMPDAVQSESGQPQILILTCLLSFMLCAYIWGRRRSIRKERFNHMRSKPDRLADTYPSRPGMNTVCGIVGVIIALLSCLSLAAPCKLHFGGYFLTALLQAIATASSAIALFYLIYESWNIILADVAMGLMTLAICLFLVSLVPGRTTTLAEHFPILFNAVIFGLAIMIWIWNWLAQVWQQQLEKGKPWTSAGYLHFAIGDFTFRIASFALLLAILMAAWPALRGIAVTDDSRTRIMFGILGYLVLLLAMLACGKRTQRTRYKRLGFLTIISMLAFVAFRTL